MLSKYRSILDKLNLWIGPYKNELIYDQRIILPHLSDFLCFLFAGLRSWDLDSTHVDLSCELLNLANAAPESDEARNGANQFLIFHEKILLLFYSDFLYFYAFVLYCILSKQIWSNFRLDLYLFRLFTFSITLPDVTTL